MNIDHTGSFQEVMILVETQTDIIVFFLKKVLMSMFLESDVDNFYCSSI